MTTAYYCIMENKRQYYISLTMLGCLFFIFGLVSWVNSILIPYFKIACELKSGVQTYLVTFAFYIAYLVMTVPASFLLRRKAWLEVELSLQERRRGRKISTNGKANA